MCIKIYNNNYTKKKLLNRPVKKPRRTSGDPWETHEHSVFILQ